MQRHVRVSLEVTLYPETGGSVLSDRVERMEWSRDLVLHGAGANHGPMRLDFARNAAIVDVRNMDTDRMHLFVVAMDFTVSSTRRFQLEAYPWYFSIDDTSHSVRLQPVWNQRHTADRCAGDPGALFHPANAPIYQLMGLFVSSTRLSDELGKIVVRKIDASDTGDADPAEAWVWVGEFMQTPDDVVELWPS